MKDLRKAITIKALIFASALSILLVALRRNLAALGILVGTFTAIGNFQLLARHILLGSRSNLQNVKPYFFLKYLTRYVIMGIILFLCAKVGLQFFLAAAAGLLLFYLVIFLNAFKECKT